MIVMCSEPSCIALHDLGQHKLYRVEVSAFMDNSCRLFRSAFKPAMSTQTELFTFSLNGMNLTNGQVVYRDKVNHLFIDAAEDSAVLELDGYTQEIVLEVTPRESLNPAIGISSFTQ
jgi:hypothetical protein